MNQSNDKTALEYAEPFFNGNRRDSDVSGKIVIIHDLPCSQSYHLHKNFELPTFFNSQ